MTYMTRVDTIDRDNTRGGFYVGQLGRGLLPRLDQAARGAFSSLQVEMPSRRWFKQASRAMALRELAGT